MDQLEDIKSKINVVDLISEYIPLKKTGRNFKALCPFHTEKTPSFIVSPERQIWHCFGCGEGGDVFGFVMQIEGVEFGDALRILAKKAGVEVRTQAPGVSQKKDRFYQMNKIAGLIYQKILLETKVGLPILDYLKKRQVDNQTMEEFLLGFAPSQKSILVNCLIKKGFNESEILKAGLGLKRKGELVDLFRNRLIFPFRNLHGEVVGFTARTISDNVMPKYLNTPQTLIFDKSRILYDLSLAKDEIRKKDLAILVEGQMDVLSSYRVGIKNVICSSGTASTVHQINLIKRFTQNIALAFDEDEAGSNAIKRSINLLIEEGIEVKVIPIPVGKDPDECIRQNPKSWQKAVLKPIPIMDFYFQNSLAKIDKKSREFDSSDRKKLSRELLPEIKKLPDKIEQAFYIQRLADLLQTEDKVVAEALKDVPDSKGKKVGHFPNNDVQKNIEPSRENLLDEVLLGIILRYYKNVEKNLLKLDLRAEDFQSKSAGIIYASLQSFIIANKSFDFDKFFKSLDEKNIKKSELSLMSVDMFYENIGSEEMPLELESLVKRLKKNNCYNQKKSIERALKKAEREKNKTEVKKLMAEFKKLVDKEGKIV